MRSYLHGPENSNVKKSESLDGFNLGSWKSLVLPGSKKFVKWVRMRRRRPLPISSIHLTSILTWTIAFIDIWLLSQIFTFILITQTIPTLLVMSPSLLSPPLPLPFFYTIFCIIWFILLQSCYPYQNYYDVQISLKKFVKWVRRRRRRQNIKKRQINLRPW